MRYYRAGTFAVKQIFLTLSSATTTAKVMLAILGAQGLRHVAITPRRRMMYAFSRDRVRVQLWRQLNAQRVPYMAAIAIAVLAFLCAFPAQLQRCRRVRSGDVDRDDRPLHRLRDPDLPAAPTCRRSAAAGRSASRTRGTGRSLRSTSPQRTRRRRWCRSTPGTRRGTRARDRERGQYGTRCRVQLTPEPVPRHARSRENAYTIREADVIDDMPQ